ncbi:MAG: sulfatase-like hydrolase/transferase [Kofleriaceae bacterium]|nr:sulfatase-like hydrolase/transferase [Kofleriaceae bacterium]
MLQLSRRHDLLALVAISATLLASACKDGGKKEASRGSEGGGGGGGTAAGKGGGTGKAPATAPPRGPEHVVYSLVDNRLSAHLERNGGLLVAGGSNGFAKYVRFGNTETIKKKTWELRQREGDVYVARLTGTSGRVDVPLTAAMVQGDPVIRLRVHATDGGAISVRVNDGGDINGQVEAGWSTVEIPVPAGQLHEGENQLLFFVRKAGLTVDWIQVGGTAPGDHATRFYDGSTKSLVLPEGGAMAWYAFVPDKGLLTGDVPDAACKVAVHATAADGRSVDGTLTGLGSAVDLAELAGKAVRLELAAAGCPEASLAKAALVVPGERPAPQRGAPPKYVVMLIMDSLRADRVRPFQPDARPEVPTWDKLAESSAIFLQNYVQGNESRVSHASLWSSLYPVKHSMIGPKDKLDLKWTTVDEVAKSAGLFTAGASANGYVDPGRWGFGQKWDKFSNHIHEALGLKAEDILDKGWKFVGDKKEPWFLYMGFVDTHVSWRAKSPWIEKYDPGYTGRFAQTFSGQDAADAATGKSKLTEREKQHVRALYDSNVSYQDDILRQLIEKLEAAGIWDQTMLIVTADHGDEQWEDGRVGHGGSNRDMLVHVPLLIHYPPMVPAGKFTEGTEIIDVVPTIADALGVPTDPEWQGQSLIPLAEGVDGGYPRLSFNSMYETSHGGRIENWKVRIKGGASTAAYDLDADPDEMKDIWGTDDAAIGARAVLDPLWLLRAFNMEWKKAVWGNAANVTERFAADLGE